MAFVEKVVKCKKCDLYFGHSEKNTKCPFCHTVYNEVEKKASAQGGSASGEKEKKWTAKTRKKSFKIWKDN